MGLETSRITKVCDWMHDLGVGVMGYRFLLRVQRFVIGLFRKVPSLFYLKWDKSLVLGSRDRLWYRGSVTWV